MNHIYIVVIPLRNEEECIGETLDELIPGLPENVKVAVGLNGCNDGTADVCRSRGVIVGETETPGYGYGCYAAMEAALQEEIVPDAYLFFAGDGANRPEDLLLLIEMFEEGQNPFVMGLRKFQLRHWFAEFGRALPNLILGTLCCCLGGQFFHDLGPLRLIESKLFKEMNLRELTWGWTIEAQLRASQLGVCIQTVPVAERERTAGSQKVSGVSIFRSLRIGGAIAAAAFRTACRPYQN